MSGEVEKLHEAKIEYQYEVDGKLYSSKRVYYGDWLATSSSSYVKRIAEEYSIKPDCAVYYDSQKPQNAVLIKGMTPPVYSLLVFGLVLIGADVCIYLFF